MAEASSALMLQPEGTATAADGTGKKTCKTTTISTIAVQSGATRIVVALLQVSIIIKF